MNILLLFYISLLNFVKFFNFFFWKENLYKNLFNLNSIHFSILKNILYELVEFRV